RGVHGAARAPVPHDRGLALVADPDRGDVEVGQVGAGERSGAHLARAVPDLDGVVLDPARAWQVLAVLELPARADLPGPVHDDGARARRALVDRQDEVAHRPSLVRAAVGPPRQRATPGRAWALGWARERPSPAR